MATFEETVNAAKTQGEERARLEAEAKQAAREQREFNERIAREDAAIEARRLQQENETQARAEQNYNTKESRRMIFKNERESQQLTSKESEKKAALEIRIKAETEKKAKDDYDALYEDEPKPKKMKKYTGNPKVDKYLNTVANKADRYLPENTGGIATPKIKMYKNFDELSYAKSPTLAPSQRRKQPNRFGAVPSLMDSHEIADTHHATFQPQIPRLSIPAPIQKQKFQSVTPKFPSAQGKKVGQLSMGFPKMDVNMPSFGASKVGMTNPVIKRGGKSKVIPTAKLEITFQKSPFGKKKTNPLKDKANFSIW